MLPRVLLFCLLLLPLVSLAQQPSPFSLTQVLGTPLENPRAIAVSARDLYVLDNGRVTRLDAQGRFVAYLSPNSADGSQAQQADIRALAADAAGNWYVADKGAREVRKFSPQGHLLLTFTHPSWTADLSVYSEHYPGRIAVDALGNIYVAEAFRVLKFTPQGQTQWVYDPRVPTNGGQTHVRSFEAIAVDARGSVFFLDSNQTITCLSVTTGQKQRSFAAEGLNTGYSYGDPYCLAIDTLGSIYLYGGISIAKCNAAGHREELIGPDLRTPVRAVAVDAANNVYAVTDRITSRYDHTGGAQIVKLTTTGHLIAKWGNKAALTSLAQDKASNFWVCEPSSQQLIKYSSGGQELVRCPAAPGQNQLAGLVPGLAVDGQGNVYALHNSFTSRVTSIEKFTAQGQFIKTLPLPNVGLMSPESSSIAVGPGGEIYVVDSYYGTVYKLDPAGRPLLHFGSRGRGAGQLDVPRAVAVDQRGNVYVADIHGHRVQQFSPAGRFQWESKHLTPADTNTQACTVGLSVDAAGNTFVGSSLDSFVQVYDANGKEKQAIPGTFSGLAVNWQGTRLLAFNYDRDAVHIFAGGSTPANCPATITGRIFQDPTFTCAAQTKPGLGGIVVAAEPGPYYGLSDENGSYTIAVDTGTYTVRQLLPQQVGRTMQPTCAPMRTVQVPAAGGTVEGVDFGNLVQATPYLNVNVASNRRRRCFRNVTTVSYSNTGLAAAPHAKLLVELPQQVHLVTADAPYTRTAKGHYVFDVGTLQPQQHGTITLQDSVACDDPTIRGLTVCTKAWITPANTYADPAGANAASITVTGAPAAGNQARFAVINTGRGATTDSLHLRVYQDADLALVQRYALAAQDSLVLRVPATGRMVRVEADQPAGHPLQAMASANVEVAARVADGVPTPWMQTFPPNDPEPEKAEDCQPIVDSFDPNDKQVLPAGLTAQHYTPTNTPLRYQIRFQNTGTDVAYRVEVVDTLAAELDLRTLQIGASSHPYRLSITGRTRPVLTFTFNNIMLPDSSRDLLGSNGFVQFTMLPKTGLAPKTRVENVADIFFDYNEPVRTNTTVSCLYDLPPNAAAVPLLAQQVIVSPTLRAFAPAQGRAGTVITVTGTHFSPDPAQNHVWLQGQATPVLNASATTLTIRVPDGAHTGTLLVQTPDGAARSTAAFTVWEPPTITSLSAQEGVAGDVVTLTGTHFSPVAAEDTVTFQGVAARVVQASPTHLHVEVPAGATSGLVRVSTRGGQAATPHPFRVWSPPTITHFSPSKGRAGTLVTVTGTHLAETAARNRVLVGSVPTVVVQASATHVIVRIPVAASSGLLQVHTPGGTATTTPFTFLPAPVITGCTPAEGNAGTVVTLTGQNFLTNGEQDTVYFQGVAAPIVRASPTSLVVEVPKGARTGPVTVAGAGGSAQSPLPFTVPILTPAEAITVYPNPATTHCTVDWQKADFAVQHVQLISAVGQIVYDHVVAARSPDKVAIPMSALRSGLYLLVLQTEKGTITKPLAHW